MREAAREKGPRKGPNFARDLPPLTEAEERHYLHDLRYQTNVSDDISGMPPLEPIPRRGDVIPMDIEEQIRAMERAADEAPLPPDSDEEDEDMGKALYYSFSLTEGATPLIPCLLSGERERNTIPSSIPVTRA